MVVFVLFGLNIFENVNDKFVYVEIVGVVYWMNKDGCGGVWINGCEKCNGECLFGVNGNGDVVVFVFVVEVVFGFVLIGLFDYDKLVNEVIVLVGILFLLEVKYVE